MRAPWSQHYDTEAICTSRQCNAMLCHVFMDRSAQPYLHTTCTRAAKPLRLFRNVFFFVLRCFRFLFVSLCLLLAPVLVVLSVTFVHDVYLLFVFCCVVRYRIYNRYFRGGGFLWHLRGSTFSLFSEYRGSWLMYVVPVIAQHIGMALCYCCLPGTKCWLYRSFVTTELVSL